MKKIICYMLIGLMLLSLAGCSSYETEEYYEDEVYYEEEPAEENAQRIWEVDENGKWFNGKVYIYLEGEDARDRLGDFSNALAEIIPEMEYYDNLPYDYDYLGIREYDDGYVMGVQFLEEEINLNNAVAVLKDLAAREGFSEGESYIELQVCEYPFVNTVDDMQRLLYSSNLGEALCTGKFDEDGIQNDRESRKKNAERRAKLGGYPANNLELPEDALMMLTEGSRGSGFVSGWSFKINNKFVPSCMDYMSANIGCGPLEGVPAGTVTGTNENVGDKYLTRGSRTLGNIFGENVLKAVYKAGIEEAEKQLGNLGTDRFMQGNWMTTYMDCEGNFRLRLSLMVENPAGRTGWYFGAYEVVVKPMGDMFTSADYMATGDIITIWPLTPFADALNAYDAQVKDIQYGCPEYCLNYSDIVHCFTQENKIKIIERDFPEILARHDEECEHVECNYRKMRMIEESTGLEVDMKNLYPNDDNEPAKW